LITYERRNTGSEKGEGTTVIYTQFVYGGVEGGTRKVPAFTSEQQLHLESEFTFEVNKKKG